MDHGVIVNSLEGGKELRSMDAGSSAMFGVTNIKNSHNSSSVGSFICGPKMSKQDFSTKLYIKCLLII